MISVGRVTGRDDLNRLVAEINEASWDDGNDPSAYDAAWLAEYLGRDGTVFVACHEHVDDRTKLLGVASARIELKPYGGESWLFVDEVDVCADQRRKGAGSAMMRELFDVARDAGCTEVWLATEPDNDSADALYRSLAPDEREQIVGYAWRLAR